MIALFLAAASLGSAVEAERTFARDARRLGQWTAFRKWSDHDAVMFVPQATWARDYLTGRKDPPVSVRWQPADSFTSCDGQVAINRGPWTIPGQRVQGQFTTVWMNKNRAWRWIYDGGQPLARPQATPAGVTVRRASCDGRPTGAPIMPAPKIAPTGGNPADLGRGESGDRTIGWDWKVDAGGMRRFRVFQWTGRSYRQVVDQTVPRE